MQEDARRSNYITWGVGLVTLASAWLVEYFGGPGWAALGIIALGIAGLSGAISHAGLSADSGQ